MGVKARQAEARRRIQNAIQRVDERLKMGEMTLKDLFQEESSTEVNKKEEGPVVEQKTVSKKTWESYCPLQHSYRFTVSKVDRQQSDSAELFNKSENDSVKEAIFAMGVKRHVIAELEDLQKGEEAEESNYHTIGGMFRSLTRKSLGKHKKPQKDEFDLHDEDVRKSFRLKFSV